MPEFLPADDAILSQALSDETATLAELDSNLAELNESLPEEEIIMNAEDSLKLQSLNSLEQSLLKEMHQKSPLILGTCARMMGLIGLMMTRVLSL